MYKYTYIIQLDSFQYIKQKIKTYNINITIHYTLIKCIFGSKIGDTKYKINEVKEIKFLRYLQSGAY